MLRRREPDSRPQRRGLVPGVERPGRTCACRRQKQAAALGRRVSARSSYLRASNYFRAAYTFLVGEPVDPRLVTTYRRHRAAFEAAAALMSPPGERIVIPYDNRALHGYLFRAAADDAPGRP